MVSEKHVRAVHRTTNQIGVALCKYIMYLLVVTMYHSPKFYDSCLLDMQIIAALNDINRLTKLHANLPALAVGYL